MSIDEMKEYIISNGITNELDINLLIGYVMMQRELNKFDAIEQEHKDVQIKEELVKAGTVKPVFYKVRKLTSKTGQKVRQKKASAQPL